MKYNLIIKQYSLKTDELIYTIHFERETLKEVRTIREGFKAQSRNYTYTYLKFRIVRIKYEK